jgi:hypothetical protein
LSATKATISFFASRLYGAASRAGRGFTLLLLCMRVSGSHADDERGNPKDLHPGFLYRRRGLCAYVLSSKRLA